MKRAILLLCCFALCLTSSARKEKERPAPGSMYVVVTDFVKADGRTDVADALQQLIDANPNRTLFFPDGTYLLSHSLLTPANPTRSVHLVLSNFAILKAADDWPSDGGAVVRLGGSHPYNSITINGSNYGLEGGIIDGSGRADGISIDSGRETRICRVSIKNTVRGIHILHGANSGSSDADIVDVNIVGNNTTEAVGVLIEGYDNTFTNMRIASVHTGIWCRTGGNSFRNIHPLYIFDDRQEYASSCGFVIEGNDNFLNYCYSDQFATGFHLARGIHANLTDCFTFWYSGKVPFQTAIRCDGPLESLITGFHAGFHGECPTITLLDAEQGGRGRLLHPVCPDRAYSDKDVSASYIVITSP